MCEPSTALHLHSAPPGHLPADCLTVAPRARIVALSQPTSSPGPVCPDSVTARVLVCTYVYPKDRNRGETAKGLRRSNRHLAALPAYAQTRSMPPKMRTRDWTRPDRSWSWPWTRVRRERLPSRRLEIALARPSAIPVSIRTQNVAGTLDGCGTRADIANAADDVIEGYVTPELLRDLNRAVGVVRVSQILPPQERVISQG